MGIFDAIKSRLGGGDQEEYYDENQYSEQDVYYEPEQDEAYQQDDRYYEGANASAGPSRRKASVFNDYTPFVSMSDVRSQELPPVPSSATALPGSASSRRAASQYKTSLPYVESSDERSALREQGTPTDNRGRPRSLQQENTQLYEQKSSADPLLKRHSLSNTGDFSTTSPAYYASRSGVGHVRPTGQARRTHKFREAVVIRPESYDDAEQVAINLRRSNAVVIVLSQTRPELAKRILDFSFGAAAALEGQVVSIGERIYALTCDHSLTEAEMELLQARGIL